MAAPPPPPSMTSTSSGGSGSPPETWGDPYIDPVTGQYVQRSSRGNIRVVGTPTPQIPPGTDVRDLNNDGLDDKTGLAVGVYPVSTAVSWTGYTYNGQPVYPNGAPAGPAPGSQDHPGYSNVTKGAGGMYGINNQTGQYELIPGSEVLGSPANNGPVTYSSTGQSGGGSNAWSSVMTAQIQAKAAQDNIAAQSAARTAEMQLQQQLAKELKAMDQAFQERQTMIQAALTASGMAQQAQQFNITARQAHEDRKVALIGQYREALRDYDARAVFNLVREVGSLSGAMERIESGELLTDNANAGAAALLGAIRTPFQGVEEKTPAQILAELGIGAPGGTGAPMTGGLNGGASGAGGASGGSGGGSAMTGGLMPTLVGNLDMGEMEKQLRAMGATEAEIAETLAELRMGEKAAQDYGLSQYYRQMTGSGQFLRKNDQGVTELAGEGYGGAHGLAGNYSGVWQTVDPSQPNYKSPDDPMFAPKWAQPVTPQGTVPVAADGPIPGTPPTEADPLPGMKDGGRARGAFVVGEAGPEVVIAPGGADVIPVSPRTAGRLLTGGLPGYQGGTISGGMLSRPARAKVEAPSAAPAPVSTLPQAPTVQTAPPMTPIVTTAPTTTTTTTTPAPVTTTNTTPTTPTTPTNPTPPMTGGLTNPNGVDPNAITAEERGLLDEILQNRMGTDSMGINPYDVSFMALTPWEQNLYFRNEAQRRGVPEEFLAQDVGRRQLAGFSGGLQRY